MSIGQFIARVLLVVFSLIVGAIPIIILLALGVALS